MSATSNGHELALPIVFQSGLQHFIDTPETYREQPEIVQSILRDVPVTWDDTVLLDGRPGSHVVIARRRGSAWWIGAINGSAGQVTVDLATLLAADDRTADIPVDAVRVACDGDEPRSWSVDERSAVPGPVDLAAAGGCVFVVG